MFSRVTLIAFGLALTSPAWAEPRIEYHVAPVENLETVDRALIEGARETIDMAAYTLTDWAIMDALRDAARRGVAVRIVLDGSQFAPKNAGAHILDLTRTPGVDIRIRPSGKRDGRGGHSGPRDHETMAHDIMHLKAMLIDARILRTGSANFSVSGEKRQDNDLVILENTDAARRFEREFERIWDASEGAKQ